MAAQSATPLLKVEGLKQYFKVNKNFTVKAVDDVSFEIYPGETYGLVGESGSGKSTIGRSIIRLYDPTAGKITFDGQDISGRLSHAQNNTLRTQMQMIFQDPYTSLDPRKNIGDIIAEPIWAMKLHMGKDKNDRVRELIEMVGLKPDHINRYPHEFSGGQRQRIGIARALILNPEFVVCDEAVSALDVSVRAQVLNLMKKMQQKRNLTYLFISHDLSVVRHVSDRVAVMYLGSVVEIADKQDLYGAPLHPYTRALLSAIPIPDANRKRNRIILEGDVPSAYNPPSGCKFHTRCPYATDRCREEVPALRDMGGGHSVACHFPLNEGFS